MSGQPFDAVVEANRALLLQRSQVGIGKYGVTLASAGLSRRQLLQHALEEALDLANYLQAEIQREDAAEGRVAPRIFASMAQDGRKVTVELHNGGQLVEAASVDCLSGDQAKAVQRMVHLFAMGATHTLPVVKA